MARKTPNTKPQQGIEARRAAVQLLNAVTGKKRLLSEVSGPKGPLGKLDAADKARAQRLALDTLRNLDRADRILGPFLRRRPPEEVHNILRLAATEIFVEKAPAHGVGNALVAIAREIKATSHSAGMVNAVVRRLGELETEKWDKLPVPRLPKWLRKPLIADYGKATVEAIEHSHANGAPLDLSFKADAKLPEGERTPTGSLRIKDAGQVTALEGYQDGGWWVQDAAAALPVNILAPKKGEAILDLCAAPGGKTMQLASAGADVTAVDISESRMGRVRENLARTKLTAKTTVSDALEFKEGSFDAILLDAPCTATGTIRRHPDLPYAKDGSEFPALFELQEKMLDHALTLLKPGGRLVFCTCSLLFDEGEIQVEDALKRHPNLTVDKDALLVEGVEPEWVSKEGGLRIRPDFWSDIGGLDGFYIAVLRQKS
ncbi:MULTISPECIES: RsmB/NOP family class I SAM-dependent RNA methyltransferase [Halocynthiibacter]|uniref:Methyltransferase domain-containing protein n=1 Tax=Halocynthiibacter halioticoli TaxID=2986804 RepID=A0AAE3J4G4_9RHOB|nr:MULTISPECIES: RsmB/NOP family class I SAM-dependent RNA methyltransferase [Halocynthiibacter]MCV6825737.1 methyltransferase domain-containing protein [Halocynthiibacter halioticoli]MCW4058738.1 methyltransferase domain-containing protein [Halocynthiibacter sp. SDUM655004]